ncbi:MAG: VWA domain-containing protein, partial [Actinobacteria bacterium]|nr:VWA domain-containing protein [Actinomycetota bacterium]
GAAEHGIVENGISSGTPLSRLVNDLHTNDILGGSGNLLRAVPDTSESALLATPALYNAAPGQQDTKIEQNQIRLPEQVLGSAQAFPDGTSVLCHFRNEQRPGAAPPKGTAVLLPEQGVFAYDAGDALGDSCLAGPTQRNWKLYPYYAPDLPVLDYTFVHVRWPGQDDAERYRTIEDFKQWLMRNAGSRLPGFRGPGGLAGKYLISSITYASASNPDPPPASIPVRFPRYRRCGDSLKSIMTCYSEARPQLVTTILLDISGSMALPTARGSRLAWAQQTGDGIAGLAHPGDSLEFLPFASSVRSSRPLGPLSQQELISHLDDQVAINRDTPLATEIDHVIGTLLPGRQTVVVLTDGQNNRTNQGNAVRASKLAADIRSRHPGLRVFLALTSGASCASEPVKTLADALHGAGAGGCVQASSSPAASAAELFADLLKR